MQRDERSLVKVLAGWEKLPILRAMKSLRCVIAALLIFALGAGTAWAVVQGDDAMQATMEASMDQPMPGGCNDCGGNDAGMTSAACAAMGTCMHGLASAEANTSLRPDSVTYSTGSEHFAGLRDLPESFPPKTSILA